MEEIFSVNFVKTKYKYSFSNHGRVLNVDTGVFVEPHKVNGFLYFTAQRVPPNTKTWFYGKKILLHKEIATQFIPNSENKKFIVHLDGNYENNRVSNLQWATMNEIKIRCGNTDWNTGGER
jgi:hypothetical protein